MPREKADQYADKAHAHADARAVHDAREEVAAQPIAAHQEVRLVGRLGGEEMAVVEKPHVGLAREVGREDARRRVAQAHRMGVQKSVHPLGRPRHMKTHRRAIGQVAILANRIVGRDDGRRGGEEIERQQTDDREPHHPRGAPPLAAQPIEERAGARCSRLQRVGRRVMVGNCRVRGRHVQSALNEEKSTRGSTITSAISASRLPTNSSTVPISTEPITR